MSEQNVVDSFSPNAAADRGNQDFGSEDFGNRDFGNEDFGNREFGSPAFGDGDSGGPGDGVQHGQGQSKSSRRRRRKRKGKGPGDGASSASGTGAEGGDGAAPVVPFVMEGESLALAASAAPASAQPQRRQSNPGGAQQPQGQGTGGKRWKKKFRDRERRPGAGRNENPGNDFRAEAGSNGGSNGFAQNAGAAFNNGANYGNGNGGGGFKRKGKQGGGQRKERSFVGPMDHSYREVNGNFADPSASTIPANGFARKGHRHHGDSQPIDHSMPRPIPIPEGAQTHIYFFIEDLFFTAKIQETARKQGVKVAFVKNEKEAVAELTSGEEENKPALIVFDLNNVNAKPLTLIPKLKTKLKKTVSIVGFLSHLQGDLKAKAVEAGCDAVMPRAAFSQNLPNLLRRYSAEEGDEVNYNQ
jgi:ActR/RegA family two-component response regulator